MGLGNRGKRVKFGVFVNLDLVAYSVSEEWADALGQGGDNCERIGSRPGMHAKQTEACLDGLYDFGDDLIPARVLLPGFLGLVERYAAVLEKPLDDPGFRRETA